MKWYFVSNYSYWGQLHPPDLQDPNCDYQIGGGETSMFSIARELGALKEDVTVFYDVRRPGTYGGVKYLPVNLYPALATQSDFDVLVAYDMPHALRFRDRARLRIQAFQLNDAHIGVFDAVTDLYFHPSNWHALRFKSLYPEISTRKQRHTLTNGIDSRRYLAEVERDPYRVIYSSSPDRGLHHLLRVWPAIREQEPKANLHIFYEIKKWLETTFSLTAQGYMVNTLDRAQTIKAAIETLGPEQGVHWYGGVGQRRLAQEQLKSQVLCYPCDPVQPTEGFSMTCLEATSAGCHLVTTNADALGELWSKFQQATILPLPISDDALIQSVVSKFNQPADKYVALNYQWSALAQRWLVEVMTCLALKNA